MIFDFMKFTIIFFSLSLLLGFENCTSTDMNILYGEQSNSDLKGDKAFQLITDSSTKFEVGDIGNSIYYFTLYKKDKSNINLLFLEGVFERKSDSLVVKILNDPLIKLKIESLQKGIINISVVNLVKGHVYEKIVGTYKEINCVNERNNILKNQKKWDELTTRRDATVNIYDYPSELIKASSGKIKKMTSINCYKYLYNQTDASEAFMYIESGSLKGWVTANEFFNNFQQKFKCELLPNGIIEKDNRQEKYILQVDSTGKVLKKEKY
jgi:hypothetical protein